MVVRDEDLDGTTGGPTDQVGKPTASVMVNYDRVPSPGAQKFSRSLAILACGMPRRDKGKSVEKRKDLVPLFAGYDMPGDPRYRIRRDAGREAHKHDICPGF